jgi:chromosome segregation ATPase
MDEATANAFAGLTKTVERGFATVAEDIASIRTELKGDIDNLRIELKSDIAALGGQIADIERDLKQMRRELNDLSEKVENVTGYRKEIDHALERIAAIERHLGINRKIAA